MVVRMKTQFKVIGFDLDGTLVNSLPDLALSVNSALADFGLPQAPEELVLTWIGNGAPVLIARALEWAKEYDSELEALLQDKEYALKVFGIERGNKKPRKDIAKWSDVKENIDYMYDSEFYNKVQEYPYQPAISDKEDISKILDLYIEKYYDENDDKQAWFDKIKALAVEMGYAGEVKEFKANPGMYKAHVGDVSTVLRVALTSRTNTPDMYEIMQVLGKDRIAKRFEVAKENLK